jgi:hypothetical protein
MNSELKPLLDSVRRAVETENWLAGLALTLALPDICASIEVGRAKPPGVRYRDWWKDYFGESYRYGESQTDYLNGEEVYLLRCAYLHQGSDLSDPEKAECRKTVIKEFNFFLPSDPSDPALKRDGTRLLLNARRFCEEMCSRVKEWDENALSNGTAEMQKRLSELLKIYQIASISLTAKATTKFTATNMHSCEKCGKLFPEEEHESLCRECR